MASDSSANPIPQNAQNAQNALDALDVDRARLADRITTPGWYHPTVATLTATAAIAPALSEPWAFAVLALFLILIGALPVFTRRGGVATSVRPTGPATRLLLSLQVGTFLVLMVASAVVRVLDVGGWWIAPIAITAFLVVLLLGKRYDRVRHAELSAQGQPR
jgi:hypothetical protein